MILLTGATGKTGQKILELLQTKNTPVRAIVRDPAKVSPLRDAGIDVIEGALENKQVVTKAMQGVERAFLLMANAENQCELEKQFIDIARQAGVSHVVKMSAIGADSQSPAILKRYHGEAEECLKQSGINYTNIQPNFFADNMLHCAQSIVEENKFYLALGEGKTGIIDIRDVAEVVVATLTESGHENKTYLITGPEILSFHDVAKIMSDVLKREITYVDLPLQEFSAQLKNWGQSDWYVTAVSQTFEQTALGTSAKITDTFKEITGKAPRSMEQFVRDYAETFS